MSEILKALHALESKYKSSDPEFEDGDQYDDPEYDRLSSERRAERQRERPRPKCCDKALKFLNCTYREDDETPKWRHKFNDLQSHGIPPPQDLDSEYWGYLQIIFCPFCGVKLPELKEKAEPPPFVILKDDEDYCSCCKERFGVCLCSYPETAWEVPEPPPPPNNELRATPKPEWQCTSFYPLVDDQAECVLPRDHEGEHTDGYGKW